VRVVDRRRPARDPRPEQWHQSLGQLRGRDRVAAQEPLVEPAQLDLGRIGHSGPQSGRFAAARPRSRAAVRRWRSAVTMTV
jgi:hypothetical protein